jgi:hypothetical protein
MRKAVQITPPAFSLNISVVSHLNSLFLSRITSTFLIYCVEVIQFNFYIYLLGRGLINAKLMRTQKYIVIPRSVFKPKVKDR